MEIYEEFIIIPIDTYGGADQNIESGDIRANGASGLLVTLYAKTAGTSTLAVRLMHKEIFEGNYVAVNADATVTTASRYLWLFNPAGAKQPAGEAAATTTTLVKQFVGIAVPDIFRIDVAKGDTSNWVFGVSGRRIRPMLSRRTANAYFEEQILITLASRTAAINSGNFSLGAARGAQFCFYVKTAGTGTITFRVNSVTIMENLAQQVSTNVVMTAAGIDSFSLHPEAKMQPAGESADTVDTNVVQQTVGLGAAGILRASVAKSDASAWVFGVSARRVR